MDAIEFDRESSVSAAVETATPFGFTARSMRFGVGRQVVPQSPYLPHLVVGDAEGIRTSLVGQPRAEEAIATPAVMDAAGVEPAKPGLHVEALHRPVAVHDAVGVPGAGPGLMPGLTALSRVGQGFGPAPVGIDGAAAREPAEGLRRTPARITFEEFPKLVEPAPGQTLLGPARLAQQMRQPPLGVDGRVDHHEGRLTERPLDGQR